MTAHLDAELLGLVVGALLDLRPERVGRGMFPMIDREFSAAARWRPRQNEARGEERCPTSAPTPSRLRLLLLVQTAGAGARARNRRYVLTPDRRRSTSIQTARTMITPISVCCQKTLTFMRLRPLRRRPMIEHAGKHAEDRAAAAEEAGAADDDRGDRVELGTDAGIGKAGIGAPGEQEAGEPGEKAAEHVDEDEHAVDIDAADARRLRVAADGDRYGGRSRVD